MYTAEFKKLVTTFYKHFTVNKVLINKLFKIYKNKDIFLNIKMVIYYYL